jgi:hypothetical protein
MDNNKFIEKYDVDDYEILTDTGWSDIKALHKTVPFIRYILKTTNHSLECADTHIVFNDKFEEVFVKDLINGQMVLTDAGPEVVISVEKTDIEENMYDFELDQESNHRYYTNGILSHNTTTYTIFACHTICFNIDKRMLIIANKEKTALEIMSRIKFAFEQLPSWLKPGVTDWSKSRIKFSNGCIIEAVSTSSSAARGKSCNVLIVDECAFIENNIMYEVWQSIMPILSSCKDAKCVMVSTPNGTGNLFYETWMAATLNEQESGWHPTRIDWWEVPGRDEKWKQKQLQLFNHDSTRFAQEFGNAFLGSSYTLINGEVIDKYKCKLRDNKIEHNIVTFDGYDVKIWKMPVKNHAYVLGGDVADGVGKDFSIITIYDITDVYNIEQVASFANNKIDSTDLAYLIAKVGILYNKCPLLIESNNMGNTTIKYLHQIYEYENIASYNQKNLGIHSGVQIKNEACLFFKKILECKEINIMIREPEFLKQLEFFEKTGTGRGGDTFRASKTNQDDHVMANIWALLIFQPDMMEYYFEVNEWVTINLSLLYPDKIKAINPEGGVSEEELQKELQYVDRIHRSISNIERNNRATSDLQDTRKPTPEEIEQMPSNIGFFDG